ncbi:hypothetical protein HDU67_002319 [Dinochytrium kinnereticum]|nr:hypothetical protein HDU67_002319 [Dinochytrium kinnereticum]
MASLPFAVRQQQQQHQQNSQGTISSPNPLDELDYYEGPRVDDLAAAAESHHNFSVHSVHDPLQLHLPHYMNDMPTVNSHRDLISDLTMVPSSTDYPSGSRLYGRHFVFDKAPSPNSPSFPHNSFVDFSSEAHSTLHRADSELSSSQSYRHSGMSDGTPSTRRRRRHVGVPTYDCDAEEGDDGEVRRDVVDSPDPKGARPAKRNRRMGENGESKDPKYVLTTEVINLKGVRYCRVYRRPPISYADLITYAIAQSPHKKLKLQSIYNFLTSTFGYFKHHTAKRGWENSIRHNLSMKSKGRFLKVKEEDDSEKGSYWHLNPDVNHFTETMENARDTAEKLEVWPGILYYPLDSHEDAPHAAMLFSEEDHYYTDSLCVIDDSQGSCTKFKSPPLDACSRRKSTSSITTTIRADLPLPPPPYRNLIFLAPENLPSPPGSKHVERKRKREDTSKSVSSAESSSLNSLAASPSIQAQEQPLKKIHRSLPPLETSPKEPKYGGLVMAYPTPTEAGDCDLFRDSMDYQHIIVENHENLLQSPMSSSKTPSYSRRYDSGFSSEEHTQSPISQMSIKNFEEYALDEDFTITEDETTFVNGASTFYEVSSPTLDEALYNSLFNDNDEVAFSIYATSLLFGALHTPDFAIPVLDVSALDIDRLIADPSIPIDNTLTSWGVM